MMRRIKMEVEKSLLPKIELKLFVGLTTLQRETYKKVLSKELTKMNQMGEESSKTLNNVLMELRKAANHPYLIEGVEPGPPDTTDKHLIDCCGKMMVLDKLLAKLKAQGSRVVMFSQFVIMLDILEDYLVWRGHEFRRLDGQTPYEDRATNIDEFNAENSNIFVYLISTRAGGLGINLATADTVIIYDSDWNPQPDFQAIDRVHRIGQKKQVRIFRLVTENTIDERIVQRAEIKSRLDKMIIQQGRTVDKGLAEATKGMKRDMIRFGVEQIMSSGENDVIDIDIDKILSEGELKTAEENTKYAKLGESELRNLTLEEASSVSIYQFEGADFRSKEKKLENDEAYGFRQRTVTSYVSEKQKFLLQNGPGEKAPQPKWKYLPEYHFYPRALRDLCSNGDGWIDMSTDKEHKQELIKQAFVNWRKPDLITFCRLMAKVGRNNLAGIAAAMPEKTLDDITKYHEAFWKRGPSELPDFERLITSIKAREEQIEKEKSNFEALKWKISSYRIPEIELSVKAPQVKLNEKYSKESDIYLLTTFFQLGGDNPDVYVRIRQDLMRSKRFQFDWYMRSRTADELQQRVKYLMKYVLKEYFERKTKETTVVKENKTKEIVATKKKEPMKIVAIASTSSENHSANTIGTSKDTKKQVVKKEPKTKSWKPVVRFKSPSSNHPPGKENRPISISSDDSDSEMGDQPTKVLPSMPTISMDIDN